mgnify:CR=1 FL=1
MLDRLLNSTRKVSLWLTWLGGTLIVLSAFLVTLEVILRKFFNISLGGADEISGYAFGVATTLAFSYALFERSHIRVDALLGTFPKALRPIINLFGLVLLIGFAAVVVVMVFFPILVNTVQGLREADKMQRDLMRTYAASYGQTLIKLRLPSAMPFFFNGLKIATTLALIGAIVAEYFGSPTRGMGFRISTGVGSLSIDLVWAEIAVAAMVGTAFYGTVAWIEKRVTFWHPSQRG